MGANLLRLTLMAAIVVLCPALQVTANDDQSPPLNLLAIPPLKPATLFSTAWTIYASGIIDQGAPLRLASLVAADGIPNGSTIFLNSPGGNLLSGIELGRLIRQHDFRTEVGAPGKQSEWHPGPGVGGIEVETDPGECLSACALTFLGGSFRYLGKGIYGVHRFYSLTGILGSDAAQIVSAAVMQFIRDMGIDARLFTVMTEVGRDEMKILPENELVTLGVVNNGVTRVTWTIESNSYGLYMKGERNTSFGYQKLILMCGRQTKLEAMAIFDPQGRQEEVVGMSAASLMIDDKQIKLMPDRLVMKPRDNNGWINAAVAIDNSLIPRLEEARTLGVMFQYTYEAPMFFGYDRMDFTKGSQLLPGFLASCH